MSMRNGGPRVAVVVSGVGYGAMERPGLRLDHHAWLRYGAEQFEAAIYGIDRQNWPSGSQ